MLGDDDKIIQKALSDRPTRVALLLQVIDREAQMEVLDVALDEGYATTEQGLGVTIKINWHGITAGGSNVLEAIDNWIATVLDDAPEAA